jgi:hypothetical protein
MPFVELGFQSKDVPKTKTLRQWCKEDGNDEIHCSKVKVVFKPGNYASWTFVTEHNFKVVVEKETVLESYLDNSLPDALFEGACLFIQIKDKAKGSWALSALAGNSTDWEEFSWGFKAGETRKTKPDSKKKPSDE